MRTLYDIIPERERQNKDESADCCTNCLIYRKQLLQTESKYFKLKLENRKIKNFILQNNLNYTNSQSQMINSLSMINPVHLIEAERHSMSHITEDEHSLSANNNI